MEIPSNENVVEVRDSEGEKQNSLLSNSDWAASQNIPSQPSNWSSTAEFLAALGVWIASIVFIILAQGLLLVFYTLISGPQAINQVVAGKLSVSLAWITLIGIFIAQLLTLGLSWFVVTRNGKRSFWNSLGWSWHPQFKWIHAVALAVLMLLIGGLLTKLLPHQENDLDRLLKVSFSIRVGVVLLAIMTAPIVEEVLYRGILYSAGVRIMGRLLSVILVTGLFALVHVPQYLGSPAAISAILLLSAALTSLRAWTGKLLPCVATHFVFNAIQSVLILVTQTQAATPETPPAPALMHFLMKLAGVFQG